MHVASSLHVPHAQDSGDYNLSWDPSVARQLQPCEMADCVELLLDFALRRRRSCHPRGEGARETQTVCNPEKQAQAGRRLKEKHIQRREPQKGVLVLHIISQVTGGRGSK